MSNFVTKITPQIQASNKQVAIVWVNTHFSSSPTAARMHLADRLNAFAETHLLSLEQALGVSFNQYQEYEFLSTELDQFLVKDAQNILKSRQFDQPIQGAESILSKLMEADLNARKQYRQLTETIQDLGYLPEYGRDGLLLQSADVDRGLGVQPQHFQEEKEVKGVNVFTNPLGEKVIICPTLEIFGNDIGLENEKVKLKNIIWNALQSIQNQSMQFPKGVVLAFVVNTGKGHFVEVEIKLDSNDNAIISLTDSMAKQSERDAHNKKIIKIIKDVLNDDELILDKVISKSPHYSGDQSDGFSCPYFAGRKIMQTIGEFKGIGDPNIYQAKLAFIQAATGLSGLAVDVQGTVVIAARKNDPSYINYQAVVAQAHADREFLNQAEAKIDNHSPNIEHKLPSITTPPSFVSPILPPVTRLSSSTDGLTPASAISSHTSNTSLTTNSASSGLPSAPVASSSSSVSSVPSKDPAATSTTESKTPIATPSSVGPLHPVVSAQPAAPLDTSRQLLIMPNNNKLSGSDLLNNDKALEAYKAQLQLLAAETKRSTNEEKARIEEIFAITSQIENYAQEIAKLKPADLDLRFRYAEEKNEFDARFAGRNFEADKQAVMEVANNANHLLQSLSLSDNPDQEAAKFIAETKSPTSKGKAKPVSQFYHDLVKETLFYNFKNDAKQDPTLSEDEKYARELQRKYLLEHYKSKGPRRS